jgi:hypothetical protein
VDPTSSTDALERGKISTLAANCTIFSTASDYAVTIVNNQQTLKANSYMPCRAHAVPLPRHAALCGGLEKSLSERHGRGMARVRNGRSMACVNQTRPHCVNQMGRTQSIPLVARHGRVTAWYV